METETASLPCTLESTQIIRRKSLTELFFGKAAILRNNFIGYEVSFPSKSWNVIDPSTPPSQALYNKICKWLSHEKDFERKEVELHIAVGYDREPRDERLYDIKLNEYDDFQVDGYFVYRGCCVTFVLKGEGEEFVQDEQITNVILRRTQFIKSCDVDKRAEEIAALLIDNPNYQPRKGKKPE